MTLTQILQKIKAAFYTKSQIDSMGGGTSLDTTIRSKANASDLNNYLPLSGGQLTGVTISRNVGTSELQINGGTRVYQGGSLIAYGNDVNELSGCFQLIASTNSSSVFGLVGTPTGSLTWGSKNIDVIDSQGDAYIRYSSGLQICWGVSNVIHCDQNDTVSFTASFNAFSSNPSILLTRLGSVGGWAQLQYSILSITPTYTEIIVYNNNVQGGPAESQCLWQAIGKWK